MTAGAGGGATATVVVGATGATGGATAAVVITGRAAVVVAGAAPVVVGDVLLDCVPPPQPLMSAETASAAIPRVVFFIAA